MAIRNPRLYSLDISKGTRERIATTSLRTGLAMTILFAPYFGPTRQRHDTCHCEEGSDAAIRNPRLVPVPAARVGFPWGKLSPAVSRKAGD